MVTPSVFRHTVPAARTAKPAQRATRHRDVRKNLLWKLALPILMAAGDAFAILTYKDTSRLEDW